MRAMSEKTPNPENAPAGAPPRALLRGFLRWLPVVLGALTLVWIALSVEIFLEGSRHLRELERMSASHRDYREFTEAAERLKAGSDNLTKAVRRYAASGLIRFMDDYEREEKVDRNREAALEIIGRKLAPDDPARLALQASMAQSLRLQDTEHHVMRLVAEAADMPVEEMPDHVAAVVLSPEEEALSPERKRQRAIDMLYDEHYFAAKSNIWVQTGRFLDETIGHTVDDFDSASAQTIRSVTRQMLLFTLALASVFLLLLLAASVGTALFMRLTRRNAALMDDLRRERDATLAAEKSKSMFFSMVSHDIRTPLNSIIGFAELLRDGISDPKERGDSLENLLFSAQTLLALVNDVLDLSKLDAEKMRFNPAPCDFSTLLSRVADSFRFQTERKGIAIRAECPPMPALLLDEERMRQVLVNLAGNAVKFTDKGGVTLRASFEDRGGGRGELRFTVADTGIGIAPENRTRILEPFVQVEGTRATGGTGLGLPICRRIAEIMGGSLSIESELGRGSAFTVVLPEVEVSPEPAPSVPEPAPAVPMPAPSADFPAPPAPPTPTAAPAPAIRSALVVDDVPVNLLVEKAMLVKAGVSDVVTADSAAAALRALEERSFDIVLSDLWMPEMDGYELCLAIRADERWKTLPVYAVTADVEARGTIAERGFDGILLKPVTGAVLDAFLTSFSGVRGG